MNESAAAFELFSLFLNLGPKRTYKAVAEESGKSYSLVRHWADKNDWIGRTRQYEDYWDRMKERALHDRRVAMIERQADLGSRMQSVAGEALANIDPDVLAQSSLSEIASLAEKGVKIERLAMGDSTENHAHKAKVEIVFSGPVPSWAPDSIKQAQLPEGERDPAA